MVCGCWLAAGAVTVEMAEVVVVVEVVEGDNCDLVNR